MKIKTDKGYIIQGIIAVIALLLIIGGSYYAGTMKEAYQKKVVDLPLDYFREETNLGGSNVSTSSLKTYLDTKNGLEFSYADILSLKNISNGFVASHAVPFKHQDPCDLKDGASIDFITDFSLSGEIIDAKVEDVLRANNYYGIKFDSNTGKPILTNDSFIQKFNVNNLSGYKVSMGVEGCGIDEYYISLNVNKTLILRDRWVGEFAPVNGNQGQYENMTGIILPEKHSTLLNSILSSLKVISSSITQQTTQPSITVLSPNGGESWKIGQTYKISFKSIGDLGSKIIRLNKYSDDHTMIGSQTIGTTNTDEFIYKVSASINITRIDTPTYKIQVLVDKYNTGMGVADESDDYFSVTN